MHRQHTTVTKNIDYQKVTVVSQSQLIQHVKEMLAVAAAIFVYRFFVLFWFVLPLLHVKIVKKPYKTSFWLKNKQKEKKYSKMC